MTDSNQVPTKINYAKIGHAILNMVKEQFGKTGKDQNITLNDVTLENFNLHVKINASGYVTELDIEDQCQVQQRLTQPSRINAAQMIVSQSQPQQPRRQGKSKRQSRPKQQQLTLVTAPINDDAQVITVPVKTVEGQPDEQADKQESAQ